MATVSIIIPAFNEQDNLNELHRRLTSSVAVIRDCSFEFVFVDDCSADQTPEILKKLHALDKRVKVIRFSRNCGSHAALAAGLTYCKGDCAITLAADLQDPPQLIERLLVEWSQGAKIVWGARVKREGESQQTQLFSKIYYGLINGLTTLKMTPSDIFLADRAVIEAFKSVSEKHTSIFMTLAWLGFPQRTIEYVKEARHQGKSKWTIGKKVKLTVDSILAFSDLPIRYMSGLGVLTAGFGVAYAARISWDCVAHGTPAAGWSLLMIAILIIGGVQMMMLGVLGEYLWRTFDESRKRPRYVVEYTIQ